MNDGEISSLYPRISARAAAEATLEEVSVIGFKDGQTGAEQLALRDDDNVVAGGDVVSAENLSYQSFSTISLHRAAEFPRRGDAEAAVRPVVRHRKHRRISAV